jgi:hypothetical protein
LHLFDLKRLQWERVELSDAPVPRIAHAKAVLDDSLIVFGGRNGLDEKESSLNDFLGVEYQREELEAFRDHCEHCAK